MAKECNMKACIFGVGAMGLPAAWAMQKLGFDLQLIEEDEERFDDIEALLGVKPEEPIYADQIDEDCDVAISCLPYILNFDVVEMCREAGIPYCDLGGNPKVSSQIQSNGKDIAVFTDLGLAPGYLNIIAEYLCNENTTEVHMRCGGLPCDRYINRLKYARTFHIEGLTNEYSGMCDIIKDGVITQVPALSGVKFFSRDREEFEMFYTKGCTNVSLQSMLDRGVKEFDYKTVRYCDHVGYIKFLMEDCNIVGRDFSKAITKACPRTKEDRVLMGVSTNDLEVDIEVKHDNQWTAMQKCTSFPTAAVAAIMAKNKDPKVWSYADVPMDEFLINLEKICGDELLFS